MTKGIVIFFSACLIMFAISCGGKSETANSSSTAKKETANAASGETKKASSNRKGRLIYKQYCVICHGADGKLAISDAKDLSVSTISMEERIDQITNGKGLMTPYKDILSAEQIQAVAEYLDDLKK